MKYLHIFKNTNEIFSEPYINFVNRFFKDEEHLFLHIGGDIRQKCIQKDNMDFIFGLNYMKLIKNMQNAEKIILHGLFSPRLVVLLYLQPWLLRKCYWVVWGGDLYYFKLRKRTIKHNIYEYLRKHVIENFKGLITLVDNDYNVAKEFYRIKGKNYSGRYINPINIDLLNTIKENKNNKGTFNIQVGNSADPSNNHFEVLDLLLKYKNENIKIFSPLSYGDKIYAKEVKSYGEKLFGSKFIAMTDFLKPEIYVEFLGSVDIGIFANNRQQALGNILALIYLGKKVYIKDWVSTWDYLKNKLSVEIFSYSVIEKTNFKEFTDISEKIKQKNRKNISETLDSKKTMLIWSEIFNA